MSLTWKDFVATILALMIAGYAYALTTGFSLPYLGSYRIGSLLLLVVGLMMCGLSSYTPDANRTVLTTISMALGGIAMIAGIAGIITGSQIVFLTLAGTIVLLWLITTAKHLLS